MDTIDDEATAPLLDGRYRLDQCVGRGATCMVYRAHDTLLGRTVAIKLLRADDEMALEVERVHNETALLASLSHPSLVSLYDASLTLPHPRFLVMEFVDGPTLAQHLARGPLTRGEVATIGRDLADALRVVHRRGIVHRDVKPSNVLLARTDDESAWVAKLTDFGIAVHPDETRRTSPGIAIGTAAYMAPEQVRSDPITPAADIYSLGLVLLEALTGEPAFPRTRDVQTALARLVSEPAIPDGLGTGWVRLLRAMTDSDPEQRPTAVEVVAQAQALATDADHDTPGMTTALPVPVAPIAASPDAPTAQGTAAGRRPWRRRTMGVFAGAAAAATVLAGAWMSWPVNDPSPAQTKAPASVAETPAQPDPEEPSPGPTAVAEVPAAPVEPVTPIVPAADSGSMKNANAGPGNNSGKGSEKSDGSQGKGKGKGKSGK